MTYHWKLSICHFLLWFHQASFQVKALDPFKSIDNNEEKGIRSPVTVVSSHYDIKLGKRKSFHYRQWWPQTLALNCPYMLFTDSHLVAKALLKARNSLPTIVIYRNLNDSFATQYILENMTIRQHVPSIELGIIWAEKMELIKIASDINPFQSEWFAWVDSGNALYRKIKMPNIYWPNAMALEMLPKNKFLHTASWFPWGVVEVAGTAFMLHQDMIVDFREKWINKYSWCQKTHPIKNYYNCASDQYILTRLKHQFPSLFYQIGYGYGDLVRKLFKDSVPETNYTNFWDICDQSKQNRTLGCDHWLIELPV